MVVMWWWDGARKRSGWAASLLTHVNLLLMVFAGVSLATGVRLQWDASTYVPVRMLFPTEYRISCAVLPAAGAALLLLLHLAAAAMHAASHRTTWILLCFFIVGMLVLMLSELVYCVWLTRQVLGWLMSSTALQLREAWEVRKLLRPLVKALDIFHNLPRQLDMLIDEAAEDAPRNLYVVAGAGAVLALLQLLAVALAALLACSSHQHDHVPNNKINNRLDASAPSAKKAALPAPAAPTRHAAARPPPLPPVPSTYIHVV